MAILNTAIVAYYLLIRLKGLLTLQSARGPVDREKVLYVLVFAGCGEGHPVSLQLHLGLHKFGRTLTRADRRWRWKRETTRDPLVGVAAVPRVQPC